MTSLAVIDESLLLAIGGNCRGGESKLEWSSIPIIDGQWMERDSSGLDSSSLVPAQRHSLDRFGEPVCLWSSL